MEDLGRKLREAVPRERSTEWHDFMKERVGVEIGGAPRPYGYCPAAGDRVRVRTFEDMAEHYENDGEEIHIGPTMVGDMCDRAGEVLVVAGVSRDAWSEDDDEYIDGDQGEEEPGWNVWFDPPVEYSWSTHMIEPA